MQAPTFRGAKTTDFERRTEIKARKRKQDTLFTDFYMSMKQIFTPRFSMHSMKHSLKIFGSMTLALWCGVSGRLQAQSATNNRPLCGMVSAERNASELPNFSPLTPLVNTHKLFVYRLAIAIDYEAFQSWFGGDEKQVYQFWDDADDFLNSAYLRDLGIQLEIVRDKRLIVRDKPLFDKNQDGRLALRWGTIRLNSLIDKKEYDVGAWIAPFQGLARGYGQLGGAYWKKSKACTIVRERNVFSLAHELGHLFGANHTGSQNLAKGDRSSLRTEYSSGQSIMSYHGTPDFFSLPTVAEIFKHLNWRGGAHYKDEAREQLVMEGEADEWQELRNFTYAVEMDRAAQPTIDKTRLKEHYKIPRGTFFGFDLVSDNKGNDLYYMAQPLNQGDPKFYTYAPQTLRKVGFQTTYSFAGGEYINSGPTETGMFDFVLAVSDGNTAQRKAPQYDCFHTKVEVVDALPFVLTTGLLAQEIPGRVVELKWQVDKTFFGKDSKVKISMSDDYGKSWKYVLVEETPNDGACEIVLPYIERDKQADIYEEPIGACIIKVEEIGGIVYALSKYAPRQSYHGKSYFRGGFTLLKKSGNIVLENLPPAVVELGADDPLPPVDKGVRGKRLGSNKGVRVRYEECPEVLLSDGRRLTLRRWSAIDLNGRKIAFEQKIYRGKQTVGCEDVRGYDGRLRLDGVAGRLHLKIDEPIIRSAIYDMSGRLMKRGKTATLLDVSDLKAGIYLVVVRSASGVQSMRWIKD